MRQQRSIRGKKQPLTKEREVSAGKGPLRSRGGEVDRGPFQESEGGAKDQMHHPRTSAKGKRSPTERIIDEKMESTIIKSSDEGGFGLWGGEIIHEGTLRPKREIRGELSGQGKNIRSQNEQLAQKDKREGETGGVAVFQEKKRRR